MNDSLTKVLNEKYASIHELYRNDPKHALQQKYGNTLQTEHNFKAWLFFTKDGVDYAKNVGGLSESEIADNKLQICEIVKDSWGYFKTYYTEDFGIRQALLDATGKRLV